VASRLTANAFLFIRVFLPTRFKVKKPGPRR
jgi:hypothetical protein